MVVVLPNMNKILQTKIPVAAFVLLLIGLLGCSFFLYADKTSLRWLALLGWSIFIIAKIGQAFGSSNEKKCDFFSIFSKVGVLIITGAIFLKGILIVKQQYVFVAGYHVYGTNAIVQGVFLMIFGAVLFIYAAKTVN
jgi:hypothetical protein